MLPSCFAWVSPLNFWQVFTSCKALDLDRSIALPKWGLCLTITLCSLIILVMLPTHTTYLRLYLTENILAYGSDLRTLQDTEHTCIRVRCQNIARHRTYLHTGQISEHCKTQNILAFGSDLRTLQDTEHTCIRVRSQNIAEHCKTFNWLTVKGRREE